MSGLFGTTIPGNKITDFAKQTASVGVPIPFGYGKFNTNGQVIWIDEVKTHVTKKTQGKGGTKVETYTYTRSYAIAFCAGPITGYLTITRNGKVVYTTDPNAKIEDKDFAAKWAQKCAFYFGTRTQMPDSTIEAVQGAGNVSAFRDLAYIVIENDDVTDGAGAVPSYQAVITATPPTAYLTSRPYAVAWTDALSAAADATGGFTFYPPEPMDGMTATAMPLDAYAEDVVQSTSAGFESIVASATPQDWSVAGVATQAYGMFESFTAQGAPLDWSSTEAATRYIIPPEAFSAAGAPQDWTVQ